VGQKIVTDDEAARRTTVDAALETLRAHVAQGLDVPEDTLPGIEAAVVALAVEARRLRQRCKELEGQRDSLLSIGFTRPRMICPICGWSSTHRGARPGA
jgi:hypothetical protein